MAPLKIWAPYERLTAADLNAAFAEVAAGKMPGVVLRPRAGTSRSCQPGETTEVRPGGPPGGRSRAATGTRAPPRVIIPVGPGGLYLVTCTSRATRAPPTATKGRLNIMPGTPPNAAQSFTRLAAARAWLVRLRTMHCRLAQGVGAIPRSRCINSRATVVLRARGDPAGIAGGLREHALDEPQASRPPMSARRSPI